MQPNVLSAENGTFARLGALSLYAPTCPLHPLLWTFPFVNSNVTISRRFKANYGMQTLSTCTRRCATTSPMQATNVHQCTLGPPKCLRLRVPNLCPPHRSQRTSTGWHAPRPQGERVCVFFGIGRDEDHNPTNAKSCLPPRLDNPQADILSIRNPGHFVLSPIQPSHIHGDPFQSLASQLIQWNVSSSCIKPQAKFGSSRTGG